MAVMFAVGIISVTQVNAFAAIPASPTTPTRCTTLTTANTPVYTTSSFSYRGAAKSLNGTATKYNAYIEGTDTIEILRVSGAAAYIRYYTTSGSVRYGWIRVSAVTSATSLPTVKKAKISLGTNYCYNRPNGNNKFGAIDANDNIWLLAISGSWYQIRFNIGSATSPSAYRIAWITKTNYEKITGTTSAKYTLVSTKKLDENTTSKVYNINNLGIKDTFDTINSLRPYVSNDAGYVSVEVLAEKTVSETWRNSGGIGSTTISGKIPTQVRITTHKHSYKMYSTEEFWGRFISGLVQLNVTATHTCSCGASYTSTWEMPIQDPIPVLSGK